MTEFKAILKGIIQKIESGASIDEIKSLLTRYKLSNDDKRRLLKLVGVKLEEISFINNMTQTLVLNSYEKLCGTISEDIINAVRRGMASADPNVAIKLVKRVSENLGNKVKTLVTTARYGIAQAQVIEDAQKVGVKRFVYEGSDDQLTRPFCRKILGQSFTLEEIERMNNGQGLPVLYYGGGWNCRHRWVADTKLTATMRIPGEIVRETEKAVCISTQIELAVTEHVRKVDIWVPKSLIKENGEVPRWFVANKLFELREKFKQGVDFYH